MVEEYAGRARDLALTLPPCDARDALLLAADYAANRRRVASPTCGEPPERAFPGVEHPSALRLPQVTSLRNPISTGG